MIRVREVRRGDGTSVTSLEPRLLLEAMSFVVDLHTGRSVLEVLGVRVAVPTTTVATAG